MSPRLSKRTAGTSRRKHKPDYGLFLVMGLLLLLGLIVIYAVSPALVLREGNSELGDNYYIFRQLITVGVALVAFFITSVLPITFWKKIQPILITGALALSLVLLIPGIGSEVNGAKRWIQVGSQSIQPSELLKFALVFYLAAFLSERIKRKTISDQKDTLRPLLIITGVLAVVVAVLQKDLGTMISIVSITFMMYYLSGAAMKGVGAYLGTVVASGVVATILFPHRLERVLTFINPSSDVEGAGYHINQALIAIGSGGMFGRGLGRSVQVFGYLPEAANDSVFAIIAEIFGFAGTVLVIVLFGILFIRMLRIIERSENEYMRLIAGGVFGWVLAHTVINIGAMLGILPLTGITLPFLSLGGTSLVMIMAALGLVFNISRYTKFKVVKEERSQYAHSRNRRRNSRARYANSSSRF
jgi:cell division protein FtsW